MTSAFSTSASPGRDKVTILIHFQLWHLIMDYMFDYESEDEEETSYRKPKSPIIISSYVNYEEDEDRTSSAASFSSSSITESLPESSTSSSSTSTSLTRPAPTTTPTQMRKHMTTPTQTGGPFGEGTTIRCPYGTE